MTLPVSCLRMNEKIVYDIWLVVYGESRLL